MITEEQLAIWVESYRADELNAAQREELRALLEGDSEFRAAFIRALADASRLDVHLSNNDLEHHLACVTDAINLQRTSQRIREVKRVSQGYPNEKPQRSSRKVLRRSPTARKRRRSNFTKIIPFIGIAAAAIIVSLITFNLDKKPNHPAEVKVPNTHIASPWSIAKVHRIHGEAVINGHVLASGVPTLPFGQITSDGMTDISLRDGTRFTAQGKSEVSISEKGPLALTYGILSINVAKQTGEPFTITGPHGQVNVIGTQFAMRTFENATEIVLSEGAIETKTGDISRSWNAPQHIKLDGKSSFSLNDYIEIKAGEGTISDPQWQLETDTQALGKKAWVLGPQASTLWQNEEETQRVIGQETGIDIAIPALAGVRYRCWIRYKCDASGTTQERLKHDTIVLQLLDGSIVSRPKIPESRKFPEGQTLASFSGAGAETGYTWVGGWADRTIHTQKDAVTIEFERSGIQRLRILAYEGPLRIDSIRLVPENGEDPIH